MALSSSMVVTVCWRVMMDEGNPFKINLLKHMPDDNNEAGGEQDLKDGGSQAPTGDGQPGNEGGSGGEGGEGGGDGAGDGEVTVTIKKSELDKIKSDRDNYRDATLDKKAKARELKKTEQDGGGGEGGGEGTGGESGEGASGTIIDETRVAEIAQEKVNSYGKLASKSNQERAKKQFLKTHKEYLDDPLWHDMMSDYRSSDGAVTVEDFVDNLENTLLIHKRRTGKLEEYLDSERERGRQEGMAEAEAGSGRSAGGVGDRNEGTPGNKLSPKGEEIARAVKLDPEKVKDVDPSKDNVISMN